MWGALRTDAVTGRPFEDRCASRSGSTNIVLLGREFLANRMRRNTLWTL
jgi:hypothetical protein